MEDPTQELQHHLQEEARHTHDPSLMKIALTSAIIAVLAAIASLLSEHQVNEALISQLQASDQWAYYQAKGVKRSVLESELTVLKAVGKTTPQEQSALEKKLAQYDTEQKLISEKATAAQERSENELGAHKTLSYAVTLLQVAIGLSAVSALTRRRWLWFSSMAVAAIGLGLLAWGVQIVFFVCDTPLIQRG